VLTGRFNTPLPQNEPVLSYAPNSKERADLEQELEKRYNEVIEIPCIVNGKRIFTGRTVEITMPCEHGHILAKAHLATPEVVQEAIDTALKAQKEWAALPWTERIAIFLKAAELLTGPWRQRFNATTMLCQAKTCHQAEIDSVCELIDFWKFNAKFVQDIYSEQPQSGTGIWNRLDYRPLEGFVFAVTPFNFSSIALNIPTAPAMMGNVAIWKPSTTQLLSAWEGMLLLEEAGLPPGVINFLPGEGADVGDIVLADRNLAGLHFTGSTPTFQSLWKTIGNNIKNYRTYPRIVGETGGKDFIVAHPSADKEALAIAILRGSFEFQGQKCSAASRVYVPESIWEDVKTTLVEEIPKMKMGDTRDFSNFMGAVIDQSAFEKHKEFLQCAHDTATVLAGGKAHGETGWFIEPTLVQVSDPKHRLMEEEIFGPIVTIYVYKDENWSSILQTLDETSPYALTGAVFSQNRYAIQEALSALQNCAGNFYINDKPTGAVVGQQPFGGARGSGTNDKAGSPLNLLRWVSPRTIKETFVPAKDWRYPFLG
jgi:1-pyrroline-5-carboxylate dehydrogenase